MKLVNKKILPHWLWEIIRGNKTFEYRKDEDNIQRGDVLCLKEWENNTYTGTYCLCDVGTVLRHSDWEDVPEGYCVISIKIIRHGYEDL